MKIAQYADVNNTKVNESFQREVWNKIWTENSLENLINQLNRNFIYWRLRKLINKKNKILEAGCGLGQWVLKLQNEGFDIIGVDNAGNTIKKIKNRYPSLKVLVADVEGLPFKNDYFDVYLSFGVIEHFEDGPQKVLNEARRVLKKKGLLYLSIPYLNWIRLIKGLIQKKDSGNFYQYLYSKGEVKREIEKAGFKIEKITHVDFISAIKRDIPFLIKFIKFIKKYPSVTTGKLSQGSTRETNFNLQKILYRIYSYVILFEARKL